MRHLKKAHAITEKMLTTICVMHSGDLLLADYEIQPGQKKAKTLWLPRGALHN